MLGGRGVPWFRHGRRSWRWPTPCAPSRRSQSCRRPAGRWFMPAATLALVSRMVARRCAHLLIRGARARRPAADSDDTLGPPDARSLPRHGAVSPASCALRAGGGSSTNEPWSTVRAQRGIAKRAGLCRVRAAGLPLSRAHHIDRRASRSPSPEWRRRHLARCSPGAVLVRANSSLMKGGGARRPLTVVVIASLGLRCVVSSAAGVAGVGGSSSPRPKGLRRRPEWPVPIGSRCRRRRRQPNCGHEGPIGLKPNRCCSLRRRRASRTRFRRSTPALW